MVGKLNIPLDKVRAVNGLLKRVGRDFQSLVSLDTAATATRKELDRIRNQLNALAGNTDRLWENIRKRTSVDETEFGFLARDKQTVVRDTLLAVKDIDFSKRPMSMKEVRAVVVLERKLNKLHSQIGEILKQAKKVRRSTEKGIAELNLLRSDIDGSVLRVTFAHTPLGGDEALEMETIVQGSLFTQIADTALRVRGGGSPEASRVLTSLAREMRTAADLLNGIEKALRGNAIGIEAIGNQAEDSLRGVGNALGATRTVTRTGERTREALSNILDLITVGGIIGGVGLIATTGGAAAAIAISVGFAARLVKTVLGLFRIVR